MFNCAGINSESCFTSVLQGIHQLVEPTNLLFTAIRLHPRIARKPGLICGHKNCCKFGCLWLAVQSRNMFMQRYWSDSFSCGSIISDSRFNNSFCRILSKSISNIRYYLQKKYLHMVILSVTMCCCTLYALIFIAYRVTGTLAMCELCLQVCAMCYLLFQAGRELIKASQ